MTVETKFMTVRAEDVSAVAKNEQGGLYIVFKSGSTQNLKYSEKNELEVDYRLLSDAIGAVHPRLKMEPQV